MSNPTAYLALATMFALKTAASSGALPSNRAELIELLEVRYNWKITPEAVDKIIRQLRAWDCIVVIEDKYAGEMLRLYGARTDEALERAAQAGHQELIVNAKAGGADWFKRVFTSQNFWDDLHRDPLPEVPSAEPVKSDSDTVAPASDRIVTLADNRREIEILQSDIRGLSEEVSTNNEVSVELGDEKDLIKGELDAAEVIVSQPSFRLARLAALVLPALRFLADKFASGAIGEMAKRIIAAILGLA